MLKSNHLFNVDKNLIPKKKTTNYEIIFFKITTLRAYLNDANSIYPICVLCPQQDGFKRFLSLQNIDFTNNQKSLIST